MDELVARELRAKLRPGTITLDEIAELSDIEFLIKELLRR
jgi:hypothetical protein